MERRNCLTYRTPAGLTFGLAVHGLGPTYCWLFLGPSFEASTYRLPIAHGDVMRAADDSRLASGLTATEQAEATKSTPVPGPKPAPRTRTTRAARRPAMPPKNGAQALHMDMVGMGYRTNAERYALATAALSRPVASFAALTPAERNAVRDALALELA